MIIVVIVVVVLVEDEDVEDGCLQNQYIKNPEYISALAHMRINSVDPKRASTNAHLHASLLACTPPCTHARPLICPIAHPLARTPTHMRAIRLFFLFP